MLCKPLFIVHGRTKVFLKAVLQYKNEVSPLQKWVQHMHNKIIRGCKCRSYCTIKSKQTRNN